MCFRVSLQMLKRGDWDGEGGADAAFLHRRGRSSGSFSEFLQVKTEDELRHRVSAEHYGGLVSWPLALLLGEHRHQRHHPVGQAHPGWEITRGRPNRSRVRVVRLPTNGGNITRRPWEGVLGTQVRSLQEAGQILEGTFTWKFAVRFR